METADISNWRDKPYNQWGFRNIDKVLATHQIKHSPQSTRRLDEQFRDFDDFWIQSGDGFDLRKLLEEIHTDGVVVLHKGKIVYEWYDRGNTKDSIHIWMSITKSVIGMVVGILQQQGKLHVDDLVTKYVPEVKGTSYEPVTIRQCIDMQSGVKYADGTHEYRAASGWNPLKGDEAATNLHDFIAGFHHPRGGEGKFDYVSVNTDLMGWVIERAAGGKTTAELIQDLLWQPMGAESDGLMSVDSAGHARAAGGLCGTVHDLARFGQLIVDDGRDVIPASWVHDIIQNSDRDAFAPSSWARGFDYRFKRSAYRAYCITDQPTDLIMCLGIHGQMLFADRKNNLVMAKTASQGDAIDFGKIDLTIQAFQEFQRILSP